jgi:predicted flap endonuclease-1-like 5' DNA nuclease
MAKIVDVEGIGPKYAAKLDGAGISTTEDLLKKGASPKGRKEIAEKTGIGEALILKWVNHVDLYRIKGVGSEYSDLLEAAGVDTIPELAQRNTINLTQKMVAVNKEKKLVRKLPVESQVADWIEQAKKLPRVLTY